MQTQSRLFPIRGTDGGIDWTFASLLGLLLLGRVIMYGVTGFTTDDAFITYRYARNLASGMGFVYNSGEHVQGTSSPLFTMLLSAFGAALGTQWIPLLSRLVSLIADVVSLSIIWQLPFGNSRVVAGIAAGMFALYPKVVLIAISGMEAPLVVMFMLLIWRWYSCDRLDLAFIASALLLLTRLDAALWIGLVGLLIFLRYKPVPMLPLIAAAALYGCWVAFCYASFGGWIPQTVLAKNAAWNHLFQAFEPVRVFAGYLPGSKIGGLSSGLLWAILGVMLLPVVIEFALCLREKSDTGLFPFFFLVYNLVYASERILVPDWYYYPGFVACFVTCGMLGRRLLPYTYNFIPERIKPIATGIVLAAFSFALGMSYSSAAVRWADNPGGLFLRQNDALGRWLKQNAHPASHVLVEPIGYIGWESNLYIDDYIGLVSPQVTQYRKNFFYSDRWYLAYVRDRMPDYIVQRNWEMPSAKLFHGYGGGIFNEPDDREWFEKHYAPVVWNPRAAERDSVYLVLYEKTDTAPLFGALEGDRQ